MGRLLVYEVGGHEVAMSPRNDGSRPIELSTTPRLCSQPPEIEVALLVCEQQADEFLAQGRKLADQQFVVFDINAHVIPDREREVARVGHLRV